MNAQTFPLRSALRALDEKRAALQTALVAALNRRLAGDLVIAVEVARSEETRGAAIWIRFTAGEHAVRVAPVMVDGDLARLADADRQPDAVAAAAALAPIEPVLAALELVLGHGLHPAGLDATGEFGDEEPLLLRLEAGNPNGPVRHRLFVALPVDLATSPAGDLPFAPGAMPEVRPRWAATIPGPRVALPRLGQLARGGLLVLGTGPLMAHLELGGRSARARLDLQGGKLILEQDMTADEGVAAPGEAATERSEPRVGTTVELSGGTVSPAELASLGVGSVLPLDAVGGTLPVRVLAGGALLAEGELVAVGQGFGVLVTAVPGGGRS